MSSISETAYPQLKVDLSEKELAAIYTPTIGEIEFVFTQYRQAPTRACLLIQLIHDGIRGSPLMLYLIDANILITANNNYYPVDAVPEYWAWLEYMANHLQC